MVQIALFATLAFAAGALAQAIPNPAGARDVGNGQGQGCCANNGQGTGICSGIGAEFQNGKQGCGFVDPNADAAIAAAQEQVARQGF
ncbi:hypothetical protein jhhlp_004941 [Lomentospora prolificans]|uniref:Biotrophy-associated secreted protein 2 n=1 Tax=Lomentospora prolificans TaxID=41688 RepID=A0A2N3N7Z5_9PEZI|nr:hypothetical protein jhhlp_004941 [Lomentospora prolificans]